MVDASIHLCEPTPWPIMDAVHTWEICVDFQGIWNSRSSVTFQYTSCIHHSQGADFFLEGTDSRFSDFATASSVFYLVCYSSSPAIDSAGTWVIEAQVLTSFVGEKESISGEEERRKRRRRRENREKRERGRCR